jgi:hypothetical protein
MKHSNYLHMSWNSSCNIFFTNFRLWSINEVHPWWMFKYSFNNGWNIMHQLLFKSIMEIFKKENYERCLSIGKREEDFANFINLFPLNNLGFELLPHPIYLWSKVFHFILFCLSRWNLPNHCTSCYALGIFGKVSMSKGAPTWFETIWNYCVEAIDCWIILSMKIKWNWN